MHYWQKLINKAFAEKTVLTLKGNIFKHNLKHTFSVMHQSALYLFHGILHKQERLSSWKELLLVVSAHHNFFLGGWEIVELLHLFIYLFLWVGDSRVALFIFVWVGGKIVDLFGFELSFVIAEWYVKSLNKLIKYMAERYGQVI